jgi:hypothetical protein
MSGRSRLTGRHSDLAEDPPGLRDTADDLGALEAYGLDARAIARAGGDTRAAGVPEVE